MTFTNENDAEADYSADNRSYSSFENRMDFAESQRRKIRRSFMIRLAGVYTLAASILSFAVFAFRDTPVSSFFFQNQMSILFGGAALFGGVFGATIAIKPSLLSFPFSSLRVEKSEYSTSSGSSFETMHLLNYVDKRFEDIDAAIEILQGGEILGEGRTLTQLSKKERDELAKRIEAQMIDKLSAESLTAIASSKASDEARDFRLSALRRLGGQVEVLGGRANSNLIWGITFSTIGIATLFFVFFYTSAPSGVAGPGLASVVNQATWLHFLESYLPRFSLVILIEIVAFFFLRLYSRTLSEIRYFQNETTNIEMQLVALLSAISLQNTEAAGTAITKLSSTERNSTIEKTQTTAEIEMHRADAEASESYINAVTNLVHGTEKGSFWRRKE